MKPLNVLNFELVDYYSLFLFFSCLKFNLFKFLTFFYFCLLMEEFKTCFICLDDYDLNNELRIPRLLPCKIIKISINCFNP
jgi:hypothetical protein